jgi:hypothetical protein
MSAVCFGGRFKFILRLLYKGPLLFSFNNLLFQNKIKQQTMLTDYESAGKMRKLSLEKVLDKIIIPSLLQLFVSCFFKN